MKRGVIILVFFITMGLNFLVKIYYSKIYDSVDISSLSAGELNDNFFKKYLIMNVINIIGTIFVFVIAKRQQQSKRNILLATVLFFIATSIIVRFFI